MKDISTTKIESFIYSVRGEKVILDTDLAGFYGVSVKRLNEAIKRNRARFPSDFLFQLDSTEWASLRPQIATSNQGGRRYRPWAFTEHGAVMVATVLRSDKAVQMSIFVVRAFMKMRQALGESSVLAARLESLEKEITSRLDSHEKSIVELMRQFLTILNPPAEEKYPDAEKREMGFHVREKKGRYNAAPKRAR
jgi:hypothetical protein